MNLKLLSAAVFSASLLTACGGSNSSSETSVINIANAQKVVNTNAAIAYAVYSDALTTAEALQTALQTLRTDPTQENLDAARKAWLVAREPYGQSEAYRFRNSPIDSSDSEGPEGRMNAWPLGEALIDYVVTGGEFGTDEIGVTNNAVTVGTANGEGAYPLNADNHSGHNIIEDTTVLLNADLLTAYTSVDSGERDVIAGYHAIEFLLWGQDLNNTAAVTDGTDREDAIKSFGATGLASGGQRPLNDFVPGYGVNTATANADVAYNSDTLSHRRHKYLELAAAQLVTDLTQVRDGWAPGATYRTAFTTVNNENDVKEKLGQILYAMATLSKGELAGERINVGLQSKQQEDEHSCFSDNTHRDIWLNAEGISNSYTGVYAGYDSDLDGVADVSSRAVNGYGLDDYLADAGLNDLHSRLQNKLSATQTLYQTIDAKARAGKPVDVLIMAKDDDHLLLGNIVSSLNAQAGVMAEVIETLGATCAVCEE